MKEYLITVNGKTYEVQVEERAPGAPRVAAPVATASAAAPVSAPAQTAAPAPAAAAPAATGTAGSTPIKSPMPGNIIKINVSVGDVVKNGDVLCVLEAMKMENDIVAPSDGTVSSVNTSKGSAVNSGDLLFTLA